MTVTTVITSSILFAVDLILNPLTVWSAITAPIFALALLLASTPLRVAAFLASATTRRHSAAATTIAHHWRVVLHRRAVATALDFHVLASRQHTATTIISRYWRGRRARMNLPTPSRGVCSLADYNALVNDHDDYRDYIDYADRRTAHFLTREWWRTCYYAAASLAASISPPPLPELFGRRGCGVAVSARRRRAPHAARILSHSSLSAT